MPGPRSQKGSLMSRDIFFLAVCLKLEDFSGSGGLHSSQGHEQHRESGKTQNT